MVSFHDSAQWVERYVTEFGHPPATAEHLQSFAANRGGRLPYRLALRAVAQHRRSSGSQQNGLRRSPSLHSRDVSQRRTGPNSQASRNNVLFVHPVQQSGGDSSGYRRILPRVENVRSQLQISSNAQLTAVCDYLSTFDNDHQLEEELATLAAELATMQKHLQLKAQKELELALAALPRAEPTDECECAVCLEPLNTTDKGEHKDVACSCRLPCGHAFHESCLGSWFQQSQHGRTCPLCREEFTTAVPECGLDSGSSSQNRHRINGVAEDVSVSSPTIFGRVQSRFQEQSRRFPWPTVVPGMIQRMRSGLIEAAAL